MSAAGRGGVGAAAVARARPVLETFGDPVLHLGALGAGQTAKALNNLLFTAHLGAASKLFALASALGVDPEPLALAITHGSGRSYGFEITAGTGFTAAPLGEIAGPLLQKDVGIVADLAAATSESGGVLFAAADAALELMGRPRPRRAEP